MAVQEDQEHEQHDQPEHEQGDDNGEQMGHTALPAAFEAAAEGDKEARVSQEQVLDATEWALSTDIRSIETPQATYEVNVGTEDEPRLVNITIQAVTQDDIDKQRKAVQAKSQPNRLMRRQGAADDFDTGEYQRRIVTLAIIDPDLAEAAIQRGVPQTADPLEAPALLLDALLRHKPGLIVQLFGWVMSLSGLDDADVVRVRPDKVAAAVGNSFG